MSRSGPAFFDAPMDMTITDSHGGQLSFRVLEDKTVGLASFHPPAPKSDLIVLLDEMLKKMAESA